MPGGRVGAERLANSVRSEGILGLGTFQHRSCERKGASERGEGLFSKSKPKPGKKGGSVALRVREKDAIERRDAFEDEKNPERIGHKKGVLVVNGQKS